MDNTSALWSQCEGLQLPEPATGVVYSAAQAIVDYSTPVLECGHNASVSQFDCVMSESKRYLFLSLCSYNRLNMGHPGASLS